MRNAASDSKANGLMQINLKKISTAAAWKKPFANAERANGWSGRADLIRSIHAQTRQILLLADSPERIRELRRTATDVPETLSGRCLRVGEIRSE